MENDTDAMVIEGTSGNEVGGSASNVPDDNAPLDDQLGVLRRGDLVRVSALGAQSMKALKDRDKALGRIVEIDENSSDIVAEHLFTVEWIIQRGKTSRVRRDYLIHTTASAEGMIDDSGRNSRKRRKPESYEENAKKLDEEKKRKKQAAKGTDSSIQESLEENGKLKNARTKVKAEETSSKPSLKVFKSLPKRPANTTKTLPKRPKAEKETEMKKQSSAKGKREIKKRDNKAEQDAQQSVLKENETSHALDLYEKHRREFERIIERLEKKVDKYRCFSDEDADMENGDAESVVGSSNVAKHEPVPSPQPVLKTEGGSAKVQSTLSFAGESVLIPSEEKSSSIVQKSKSKIAKAEGVPSSNFREFPPLNWKMIRRRMDSGYYVLDREKVEEEARFSIMEDYYSSLDKKPRRRYFSDNVLTRKQQPNPRVRHRLGVHWDRFRDDVLSMCDAAIEQETDDPNDSYSKTSAANKIKEQLLQAYERTGRKQMQEMERADGAHKFLAAIERSENKEAAMQSHKEGPFPERIYERLSADTVCDGLSKVDEEIAIYERQTSLKDSFVGLAYRYDDTGQSEAWMKSVVDETALNGKSKDKVRQAALALSADDGVTRAQVVASMQSLLIGVQDKVLTEQKVLGQPEIRSVNWEMNKGNGIIDDEAVGKKLAATVPPPEIVEQPVWGIDCYTRRNITACLQIEFDPRTALLFIEKWLLPAINACPVEYAQDVSNAAKLLEGLPLNKLSEESSDTVDQDETDQQTILGAALRRKIEASSPSWLKAAASELRRARTCLGPNFFRVHPKGHGSVLLSQKVDANRLVTFYRGELYPSWRWGEKMDAITMTQDRKNLKPALPDFYNMALERPQIDPRGYGLLFVDASRKAGYGSSLSHSCDPTCEVRVAAKNGELCLAMTTLRELEMGEELTFDYHAVTESLNEYKSAVCLCGYGKCRGSFLHFATADCYQQVLNRNAPIATRFSNLVKGSTKQVMSEDDERVLRNHGFSTAAFGAISVNRREEFSIRGKSSLVDSMDLVPVWLKTYVADTLRYIEYERRALPISLICDHLSTVRHEQAPETAQVSEISASQASKPPGREPAFFCYSRVEHDYFLSFLRKDPLYQSLSGLELKSAVKKLASSFWQKMSEDKKEHWKKRAQMEYEKKKKAWLLGENLRKRDETHPTSKAKLHSSQQKEKKSKRGSSSVPDIQDVLFSSKISFEDADAEGVSAMEQRIQQLTQSLNRVGRVLDRHREGVLESSSELKSTPDLKTLRQIIHAPVSLLSDEAVVSWMWCNEEGVIQTLLRFVREAKSSRPSLGERLEKIKEEKYSFLANFKEPLIDTPDCRSSSATGIEGRLQLKNALLDMREIILDELKEMGREFRLSRSTTKAVPDSGEDLVPLATSIMDLSEDDGISGEDNNVNFCGSIGETNDFVANVEREESIHPNDTRVRPKVTTEGSSETQKSSNTEEQADSLSPIDGAEKASNASSIDIESGRRALSGNSELATTIDPERPSYETNNETIGDGVSLPSTVRKAKTLTSPEHSLLWLSHYDQRVSLQAAADVLLLYAHTSNFFIMKTYEPLESSPVEVYAREIGNSVPLSIIDDVVLGPASIEAKNNVVCGSDSEEKRPNMICRPDDIVASVTVRYEGDYVLSQLLQWYNGGIGQKQGLPDLLGCVMLPSMDGCWTSPVAQRRRKPEKKTPYETKVRPRLIEWIQDPFQRGSPWPDEVRQAFIGDNENLSKPDKNHMMPFGSPILDFLVTGDESNIHDVLKLLDAQENVAARTSSDGLLSSVDRGRPAQAVSTWVQCESADCLKWRKIPWHVDVDLLPEKFYCKDNIWNPLANSCDAPEDEWDAHDSLVDANGKVEGSPIKKRKRDSSASPLDEKSFIIGARFDVRRHNKEKFEVGIVSKVDFSGKVKRIQFHFPKVSSKYDEWIDFGSERIARLNTNVPKDPRHTKKAKNLSPQMPSDDHREKLKWSSAVDLQDIKVGDAFDVYREGEKRVSVGVVEQLECNEESNRILFHFSRINLSEWIDYDKEKIKRHKPRTSKDSGVGFSLKNARCPATVDEENIDVGDVFDVFRDATKRASMGVVEQTEFMEDSKRILFRFPRTNPQVSEWCDFDMNKIKPYKPRGNKDTSNAFSLKTARCPSTVDAETIEEGDVFDVFRDDTKRASMGVVEQIEFTEDSKRILFRFPRTNPQVSEWCDFDMSKIKPSKPRGNKDPSNAFNLKTARCPSTVDTETIEEGDVFDVFRDDTKRASMGVVEQTEFTENSKRILFRFPRTNPQVSEWCDFDMSKIKPYKPRASKEPGNAFSLKTARCPSTVDAETIEEGDVFDVFRDGTKRTTIGVVEQTEFAGESKRILFRFPRAHPEISEWCDLDMNKIKPYKPRRNKDSGNTFHLKAARCPSSVDARTIKEGDVFDVFRDGINRASMGVVEQLEITEDSKRVLFRFPRAHPEVSEWFNLDSSRIKPFKRKAKGAKGDQEARAAKDETVGLSLSEGKQDKAAKDNSDANGLDLLLTAISGQGSHSNGSIPQLGTNKLTTDTTQTPSIVFTGRQSSLPAHSQSHSVSTGNHLGSYLNQYQGFAGAQGEPGRLMNFAAYGNPYGFNMFDQRQYGFNYGQGGGLNGTSNASYPTNLPAFNGGVGFNPQAAHESNATGNNGGNLSASADNLQPKQKPPNGAPP